MKNVGVVRVEAHAVGRNAAGEHEPHGRLGVVVEAQQLANRLGDLGVGGGHRQTELRGGAAQTLEVLGEQERLAADRAQQVEDGVAAQQADVERRDRRLVRWDDLAVEVHVVSLHGACSTTSARAARECVYHRPTADLQEVTVTARSTAAVRTEFPHADSRDRERVDSALRRDTARRPASGSPSMPSQHPVPAILEYLPYRKDDGTALADALQHPYFAGHGYASVRVDLRGTGDSDGLLLGEYLKQEQDDALEVLAWLAEQPWCTGDVGMIGYSWGGFNGLQVAARAARAAQGGHHRRLHRRPLPRRLPLHGRLPARVGHAEVVVVDARLRDPAARPALRGRRAGARCGSSGSRTRPSLRATGSRTSGATRSGDTARSPRTTRRSRCPVMAVGGWADAYVNAVPRLLENLERAAARASSDRGAT